MSDDTLARQTIDPPTKATGAIRTAANAASGGLQRESPICRLGILTAPPPPQPYSHN